MTYEILVMQTPGLVWTTVHGDFLAETVRAVFAHAKTEGAKCGINKFLVDVRDMRWDDSLLAAHQLARHPEQYGVSKEKDRIAIVYRSGDKVLEFYQTVLQNWEQFHMQVFTEERPARDWLGRID